jgi:hypothetical protein
MFSLKTAVSIAPELVLHTAAIVTISSRMIYGTFLLRGLPSSILVPAAVLGNTVIHSVRRSLSSATV